MLGAGEAPSVAASTTRSVSAASRSSAPEPLSEAVVSHRSELLGSAPEASRTVQPFASVLGAAVGASEAVASAVAPGVAAGAVSSPHLVVTSVADNLSQLSMPVTETYGSLASQALTSAECPTARKTWSSPEAAVAVTVTLESIRLRTPGCVTT